MSTHNIGFYEDLIKIIFELSSNIIKYAPYFFYWYYQLYSYMHSLFLRYVNTPRQYIEIFTTVKLLTIFKSKN